MGFGVEFDPPVEVLFRHCDNSNNAGLTGTVHEGMKARGGTPEGSGASLSLSGDGPPLPPVSFAMSKPASRASSQCVPVGTLALYNWALRGTADSFRVLSSLAISYKYGDATRARKRAYYAFSSSPYGNCLCTFANTKSLTIERNERLIYR